MKPAEIEVRFYDTYYFANVVKNILDDPFAYNRSAQRRQNHSDFLNLSLRR